MSTLSCIIYFLNFILFGSYVTTELIIDGVVPNEIPTETMILFQNYPSIKYTSQQVSKCQLREIGGAGLLYLGQREMAVTISDDQNIQILGTDDSTTCIITIIRHTGSYAVGLAHMDNSSSQAAEECISNMVEKIQSLSSNVQGNLEMYLVGGFDDDLRIGEEVFFNIMQAVQKQSVGINLKLACIGEYNTISRNNALGPLLYGVGTNLQTGEIFPATYTDKGPDMPLRTARLITGGFEYIDIYDSSTGLLTIGPFDYEPLQNVDQILNLSDEEFLQQVSATPDAEPPDFVARTREALAFLRDNTDPAISVFPNQEPHNFQKDANGLWIEI